MSARPALVVFDWDGTLADSVASIAACLHAATADLGLPRFADDRVRHTVGMGMDQILGALGLEDDPRLARQLIESYRRHWFSTYRDRSQLFTGAGATLERMTAEGYLLAVATGKGRRGLDRDLERSGLATRFHATRTADEAFAKPHPQMLLDLLAELGVKSGDALMVGDTTFDLEMAANAGVRSVAVATGTHPRRELEGWRPLACLADVSELPGWLNEHFAAGPRTAGPRERQKVRTP